MKGYSVSVGTKRMLIWWKQHLTEVSSDDIIQNTSPRQKMYHNWCNNTADFIRLCKSGDFHIHREHYIVKEPRLVQITLWALKMNIGKNYCYGTAMPHTIVKYAIAFALIIHQLISPTTVWYLLLAIHVHIFIFLFKSKPLGITLIFILSKHSAVKLM